MTGQLTMTLVSVSGLMLALAVSYATFLGFGGLSNIPGNALIGLVAGVAIFLSYLVTVYWYLLATEQNGMVWP